MELMMMVCVVVAMWLCEKRTREDVVVKSSVMHYVSESRGAHGISANDITRQPVMNNTKIESLVNYYLCCNRLIAFDVDYEY